MTYYLIHYLHTFVCILGIKSFIITFTLLSTHWCVAFLNELMMYARTLYATYYQAKIYNETDSFCCDSHVGQGYLSLLSYKSSTISTNTLVLLKWTFYGCSKRVDFGSLRNFTETPLKHIHIASLYTLFGNVNIVAFFPRHTTIRWLRHIKLTWNTLYYRLYEQRQCHRGWNCPYM